MLSIIYLYITATTIYNICGSTLFFLTQWSPDKLKVAGIKCSLLFFLCVLALCIRVLCQSPADRWSGPHRAKKSFNREENAVISDKEIAMMEKFKKHCFWPGLSTYWVTIFIGHYNGSTSDLLSAPILQLITLFYKSLNIEEIDVWLPPSVNKLFFEKEICCTDTVPPRAYAVIILVFCLFLTVYLEWKYSHLSY